jgi:3-deoxy-D-manno-octulosonic-acid transferase
MRWWFYNVLFVIGYALMMPSFVRRMRKRGGYRAHFQQRLGRYEPDVAAALASRRRLWVHAVSVGEAFAAGKLIEELRRQSPDSAFVLSTTSSTGYGVCQKLVGPEDVLIYFPTDFPWVVRRALDAVRPLALVLTESELWPNMLLECARRGIPAVLVNGRISDRSYPRYRALRCFFGPVLRTFRLLMVQFEQDRDRLVAVGASPGVVRTMGTVKFDVQPPAADAVERVQAGLRAAGIGGDATVLLGASTWPGEEATLLAAYSTLRRKYPALRLVLVPRHMERGDEVEAAVKAAGFACARRSRMLRGQGLSDAAPKDSVLLADTTGELLVFHAIADVVFVGKTLDPNVGGQNMIEPAALGKAVVVGPHTVNFAGVMAILRAAGVVREIPAEADLHDVLDALLADAAARREMGCKAAATVAAQAGALARSAAAVLEACGACVGRNPRGGMRPDGRVIDEERP